MSRYAGPNVKITKLISYFDAYNEVFSNNNIVKNLINPEESLNLLNARLEQNYIKFVDNKFIRLQIDTIEEDGSIEIQVFKNIPWSKTSFSIDKSSSFEDVLTPTPQIVLGIGWNFDPLLSVSVYANGKKIRQVNDVSIESINTMLPIEIKCNNIRDEIKLVFIRYYETRLTDNEFAINANAILSRKP